MKEIILKIFTIIACYILLVIPGAQATTINLIFNGQVSDTVELNLNQIINKEIDIFHSPSDFSWTNVRVDVSINGASLGHTIENIYVYHCKLDSPVGCIRQQPETFESFVDAEFPWRDISQPVGPGFYPEVANIMFLVKLRGSDGNTIWIGSFDTIKRTAYNEFDVNSQEIADIDFHVRSQDLIQSIVNFIENQFMVPFNWANKVVFQDTNKIFGLGANTEESAQNPPAFLGVTPASNEINQISKEYFVIFPNTSSGIVSGITLNSNPLFSCGNGIAEGGLGESQENCCYDVGCPQNQYCDMIDPEDFSSGVCKEEGLITMEVVGFPVIDVGVCGEEQQGEIIVRINNPPTELPVLLSGTIELNSQTQSVSCDLVAGSDYSCPISFFPTAECGSGTETVFANTITLGISYNDATTPVTRELTADVPDIRVNYDCVCGEGQFCDFYSKSCHSEDSIALKITAVTSYIDDFNPAGDSIELTVEIENAPVDLTVNSVVYNLGQITFDSSSVQAGSGTITCNEIEENVFACSIPLSLPNYDNRIFYTIRDNSIEFSVSFSNDPNPMITKTLVTSFSDISIPSYYCGDGQITTGENSNNCCYDYGCGDGKYCDLSDITDPSTGVCKDENAISLSVLSPPVVETDICRQERDGIISVKVNNPPSILSDTINGFILLDGEGQSISCDRSGGSNYNCGIRVTANAECGSGSQTAQATDFIVSLSFSDGPENVIKELTTDVPEVSINYGCACDDGLYCDPVEVTCEPIEAITLNIINVTSFIEVYEESGDFIDIYARIDNAPSDLVVNAIEYELGNISSEIGTSGGSRGSVECVPMQENVFFCSIPFVIPDYDNTVFYSIRDNRLDFSVSFSNEPEPIETTTLSSRFSDISIPSFFCGDSIVNYGETEDNCCIDVGCSGNRYCDKTLGCVDLSRIELSFVTADPVSFTDCRTSHEMEIKTRVLNPPSEFTLDTVFFSSGGTVTSWNIECSQTSPGSGNGIIDCLLTIPPIEECDYPQHLIGNNELDLTIGFDDGTPDSPYFNRQTKDLSVSIPGFQIAPTYICGNGVAETDIGESPENCCVDVPCETQYGDNYFCDVSTRNPNGTCQSRQEIRLVVTSPTTSVNFNSCEISNDVTVKAYVQNQPESLSIEEEYANLNGTTVRDFYCTTDRRFGTRNLSLECTLTIDSIDHCTQGRTYNFGDGSVHLLISYENGV